MQTKNSQADTAEANASRRADRLRNRRYEAQANATPRQRAELARLSQAFARGLQPDNATPRQRAELARRKAQGIALVLSPMKFLVRRLGAAHAENALYTQALRTGYGSHIQRLAVRVANGGAA